MHNKDLIVQLIQQDLKHSQLTQGLQKLGLNDSGIHCLDLISIVASLMGIPKGKIQDHWAAIYGSFLDEAHKHPISNLAEELKPLAEKCYDMLFACTEIENQLNSNS
ncbi:MAG: hypothetical protein COA50_11125 [Flavobacteriaceae bacterium]|nr:MAG: hypothetical protein COA50_11125 [Flavobacteriaceae bacterium]